MKRRSLREAVLVVAGLLLLTGCASYWYAQPGGGQQSSTGPNPDAGDTVLAPKQDQQPSAGPNPDVGDTVLVPKKTQPAPPEVEKKPEKINPDEVFSLSSTTNLVNVDVMVLDKDGKPLSNLDRKNFKLYDDGVPQSVSNFGMGEAPMTTCMVVEFANRYWAFLYLALRYGYEYVHFIQPKDWTAVISFDLKPYILTDFTQDRSQVVGALDMLRIPGFSESNLYDALAFTLDRMKDVKGRKSILVICTGFDSFSKLTYDQTMKIVKSSDIAIYPVSILEFLTVRSARGDSIGSLQARNSLETFAKLSGGQAYFPRFEGELPGVFEQINGQLRQQYSLGFVPTNPAKDGKFHKLKVDLVDDQGNPLRIVSPKGKQVKYRIVSRDGYYAPKS